MSPRLKNEPQRVCITIHYRTHAQPKRGLCFRYQFIAQGLPYSTDAALEVIAKFASRGHIITRIDFDGFAELAQQVTL